MPRGTAKATRVDRLELSHPLSLSKQRRGWVPVQALPSLQRAYCFLVEVCRQEALTWRRRLCTSDSGRAAIANYRPVLISRAAYSGAGMNGFPILITYGRLCVNNAHRHKP